MLATVDGRRPSALSPRPGLLSLDHLDSYVRSGRAHGRERVDPAALLASPATSGDTERFLTDPTAWQVLRGVDGARPSDAIRYDVHRLYLARPLVDGEPLPAPEPDPRHVPVPATFWITPGP